MKKPEFISKVVSKAVSTASSVGFKLQKKSPEILIICGVVGAIGSTVLACRATTKIGTILDETHDTVEAIHKTLEDPAMKEKYSEDDGKKDLVITYAHTGLNLVKLYGPALILGTLSITGILVSNNILRKRNMALAAAYAAVDKGFKEYRKNVVERFGEKVDHELKYNIKAKKFDTTVTDEKTGKTKTVKETVEIADGNLTSPYSVYFTRETSRACETNQEYNIMFLKAQQQYANDLLRSRGHIFLNEVFDDIGMRNRVTAGQIVGWTYNEKNPIGDNFVDFGIKTVNLEVDGGYESVIVLDFNVDGDILHNQQLGLAEI